MVFADNVTAVLWCVLYNSNNIKYTLLRKDKKVNTGLCFGPLTWKMTSFDLSLVVSRTSPSKVKTETTTWKYQNLQIPFLVCLRSKGENIEIKSYCHPFFYKYNTFLFLFSAAGVFLRWTIKRQTVWSSWQGFIFHKSCYCSDPVLKLGSW